MGIKRFDCKGCSGYCYGGYHMSEHEEGDYVSFEDYDTVLEENKRQNLACRYTSDLLEQALAENQWLRDRVEELEIKSELLRARGTTMSNALYNAAQGATITPEQCGALYKRWDEVK